MSIQLDALKKAYVSNRAELRSNMIAIADNIIDRKLDVQKSHLICDDGIFEPLYGCQYDTGECAACVRVFEDEGNEGDECVYMIDIWCLELMQHDAVKYAPIVVALLDINVNGL